MHAKVSSAEEALRLVESAVGRSCPLSAVTDEGDVWRVPVGLQLGYYTTLVDKRDGQLTHCSTAFDPDTWLAFHRLGLREDPFCLRVDHVSDLDVAVDLFAELELAFPSHGLLPARERWTAERLRRRLAGAPTSLGNQVLDARLLRLKDARGFSFSISPPASEPWPCRRRVVLDTETFRAVAEDPETVRLLRESRERQQTEVVTSARLRRDAIDYGPRSGLAAIRARALREALPCRILDHKSVVSAGGHAVEPAEVAAFAAQAGADLLCTSDPSLAAIAPCATSALVDLVAQLRRDAL